MNVHKQKPVQMIASVSTSLGLIHVPVDVDIFTLKVTPSTSVLVSITYLN